MLSSTKKLIIIGLVVAVLGTIGIIFGTMVYVQGLVVHPDQVVTVYNPTTNKRTQSYLIGDLQVYIEQTYRMEMSVFQRYVNMSGFANYGDKFSPIESGDESLSLIAKDKEVNPNPFVVKLNIRNVGPRDREIRSRQFFIRRNNDKLVSPDADWQDKLAEAGFFAGVAKNDKNILHSGEVETLWLVYGTTASENPFENEHIRQLYGSPKDWLAVKVEYPFNFVYGTPYGDYDEITSAGYKKGAIALLLFYAIVGITTWRIAKNQQEA